MRSVLRLPVSKKKNMGLTSPTRHKAAHATTHPVGLETVLSESTGESWEEETAAEKMEER